MSRFRVLAGGVFVFALVLVAAGGLTGSAKATSKPPAPPPVYGPFDVSHSYVDGVPAIKPHAAPNTPGPAFTQDDVITYFRQYGFFAGPVVEGAHLQILTIQFVPSKQASELMQGESVGRPDDYLVCYVKVQGPFLLTNVHGGPAGSKMPPTAKYGDSVFDAHTGNLLVWGIYSQ